MTTTAEVATATKASAPVGIRARYRAWYEKLPTGLQMIGMQVWLPVFFVIAFVFCYLFAFHAPAFKNVPVAVVGPTSVMQPVAEQLQSESKGAVKVRVIESIDAAKAEVRSGEIAAAYQPGQGEANLVIASAGSFQLASLASSSSSRSAQHRTRPCTSTTWRRCRPMTPSARRSSTSRSCAPSAAT